LAATPEPRIWVMRSRPQSARGEESGAPCERALPSAIDAKADPAQMEGGRAPNAILGADRFWRGACAERTIDAAKKLPTSGADDECAYDP
jgi:hypothetical protein